LNVVDLVYGKLVLVTGKGGVGKTTVSAAIAQLAAAQGRKTLLVEFDNQHPSTTAIYGMAPTYEPKSVAPDLYIANLDWMNALAEWVEKVVGIRRIVGMILRNRMVQRFLDATPGSREVVLLSKLVWLCEEFDLVVVDLPASGHAVSVLQIPWMVERLFSTGPIRQKGQEAMALLGDPSTHLVMVALPEEMVVNETLETYLKLREQAPVLRIPLVVLNQSARPTLDAAENTLLDRLSEAIDADHPAADLIRAGRWEAVLERATAVAQERLTQDLPGVRLLEIPRLSREHGPGRLVRQVSAALARSSQVVA
jgi:anion-transporting  ArsA/GET3 family ATPase